jgi:hypothetical protein
MFEVSLSLRQWSRLRSILEATTVTIRPRVLMTALACLIASALAPAAAAEVVRRASVNLELWLSAVRSHVPGQTDRAVTSSPPGRAKSSSPSWPGLDCCPRSMALF